jgi:hypothetical protein
MKENTELVQLSKKKSITIPEGYVSAKMEREYLENDFAKFRKSYVWNPDNLHWDRAVQAFTAIYQPMMMADTMSFDEAVSKIELSASPGFPWNQKYQTKRDALKPESEGGCLELIRSIIEQIQKQQEVCYTFNGKTYTDVFFLTSPKAEIRPIEKYNNPDKTKRKTRTFMCSDLIVHIVGFMLYKKQNDAMMMNSDVKDWSTVGTNPWYGGWDDLSRSLLRNKSKEFNSMDVSHMEASVSKPIQETIYIARNSAIRSQNTVSRIQHQNMQDWYLDQITDSLIIDIEGRLCQKFGKNPSGQLNTLTDNTLTLALTFLYTISFSCPTYSSLVVAYREIAAKILGDDSLFEKDFRLKDIMTRVQDLGFEFTYEAPPGPLQECTFLNSRFHFHELKRMWIQKPNFEKILANVLYNFKKSSWRYTYVKLCAARKLVWAFPEWRQIIDEYLSFVTIHKMNHMLAEKEVDKELTFEAALAQFMPDRQNEFLIFGDENSSTKPSQQEALWSAAASKYGVTSTFLYDEKDESFLCDLELLPHLGLGP